VVLPDRLFSSCSRALIYLRWQNSSICKEDSLLESDVWLLTFLYSSFIYSEVDTLMFTLKSILSQFWNTIRPFNYMVLIAAIILYRHGCSRTLSEDFHHTTILSDCDYIRYIRYHPAWLPAWIYSFTLKNRCPFTGLTCVGNHRSAVVCCSS
jgi:hypothetical protein